MFIFLICVWHSKEAHVILAVARSLKCIAQLRGKEIQGEQHLGLRDNQRNTGPSNCLESSSGHLSMNHWRLLTCGSCQLAYGHPECPTFLTHIPPLCDQLPVCSLKVVGCQHLQEASEHMQTAVLTLWVWKKHTHLSIQYHPRESIWEAVKTWPKYTGLMETIQS